MSQNVIYSISGGGVTMSTALKDKITNYEVTYSKLWDKKTGRSVSGTMSGTIIGIFPTISIEFGRLNDVLAQELAKIVNATTQTISYYDAEKGSAKELKFYADDFKDKIVNASQFRRHDKVTINFVAWNKRGAV